MAIRVSPQVVNNPSTTTSTDVNTPSSSNDRYISEEQRYADSINGKLGLPPSLTEYQQEFVNSAAFRQAYDLFSNGPAPESWLPRLTSLVNSIVHSGDNDGISPFDFFFHRADNKEGAALLQTAFTNLSNLVSEYNQWFNSLPTIQRQQFADAGMNIALDGGSAITGSSVPQGTTQVSDSLAASNQAFDNVLNFATSISGGMLDLISTVNNVFSGIGQRQLQRQNLEQTASNSLQSVNLQRMQLGLNPITELSTKEDISQIGARTLIDSGFYKKVKESEDMQFESLISQSLNENLRQSQMREGQFAAFADITQNLGQIYFGQKLYEQLSAYEKSKFTFENSKKINELGLQSQETGLDLQKIDLESKRSHYQESSSLNDFHKKLIDYKREVLRKWVDEAGSDNPNAWLYASLLMKSNFDMTEFMSPVDVGFEYGKNVTDIIGSFFPKFSFSKKKINK